MTFDSQPALVKTPLAESDDRVSTDTGSDHQSNFSQPVVADCATISIGAKEDSSMRHTLGPAPGTWTGLSPQKQQKSSNKIKKKAATAPNPGKLPSKKRRGCNVHQVSSIRSALRNQGNEVMSQMSGSSRKPGVTEPAWLAGAAAACMPLPHRVERRPVPVPNIYLPDRMADVAGYRHFAPARPNYQLSVPSYCSTIRRADTVPCVPSYCSAIRRADSVPCDTHSSPSYCSAIRKADTVPYDKPASDPNLEPAYLPVTGNQLVEVLQDSGICWIRL